MHKYEFLLSINGTYLLSLHLLADDLGGGVEGKVDLEGGQLQLLDGESLPHDTRGGSVQEDAVLVNDIDDGGDLARVGAISQDGNASDLYKLAEWHL